MHEILKAENPAAVAILAAEKFLSIGNSAIRTRGLFVVSLAGGSTPRSLYSLLATASFNSQINWAKVYFFLGDERVVESNSDESNFHMVNENLFEPLNIPAVQVFRWKTELENPEIIAEQYEQSMRSFFENTLSQKREETAAFPRFDLFLLGIGEDGHTASLFPHTNALIEKKRLAIANPVEKFDAVRLTMTFPVINRSSNVVFLVTGREKAPALKNVLEGDYCPEELPAQFVKPVNGELLWLIDDAASQLLKRR